ncbi:MAG TPA: DUF6352 family protein [Usitatibacter sp.]|nr:DUF6352 family protein [Usitatibacter sp.]
MAQDFWASSGYRDLVRVEGGLAPAPAWFARFLARDELAPPGDAGPAERELHARLAADPMARVSPGSVDALDDPDARENWREFLRFRDRVAAFPTLEAAYRDLYSRPNVDLAPPFVDALVHAITRGLLEGSAGAWLCRAGEMLFRPQRVSTESGQVLAADAATLEAFQRTGGFGNAGRFLVQQGAAVAPVKMDVLDSHNAALYFLRDELYGFVLDLTPGREGARALARVLERWVAHLAGVAVAIEPLARIDDERWRWHIGLDVDSTAILNALYRAEPVAPEDLERLALLFRMTFDDRSAVRADVRGRPVYLGLACRPDRTLRVKPQNLLVNLPLAAPPGASA